MSERAAETLALLLDNLGRGWAPSGNSLEVYTAALEDLLSERQRLQEALREIRDSTYPGSMEVEEFARAALAAEEAA